MANNTDQKTYRKQMIDEDRYAAVVLMRSKVGRGANMDTLSGHDLTVMTAQAGKNLIFRTFHGRDIKPTVELSIKGIKFCEKWDTLTDFNHNPIETVNRNGVRTPAKRINSPHGDHVATRVDAILSLGEARREYPPTNNPYI